MNKQRIVSSFTAMLKMVDSIDAALAAEPLWDYPEKQLRLSIAELLRGELDREYFIEAGVVMPATQTKIDWLITPDRNRLASSLAVLLRTDGQRIQIRRDLWDVGREARVDTILLLTTRPDLHTRIPDLSDPGRPGALAAAVKTVYLIDPEPAAA